MSAANAPASPFPSNAGKSVRDLLRAVQAEHSLLQRHPVDFASIVANRLLESGVDDDVIGSIFGASTPALRRAWSTVLVPERAVSVSGRDITAAAARWDHMVAGTGSGQLHTWLSSTELTAEPDRSVDAHAGRVGVLQFLDSDEMIVSGGDDGLVKLWQPAIPEGVAPEVYEGHASPITAVAASTPIAAGGADGAVRVWQRSESHAHTVLVGHGGAIRALAISSSMSDLVSASDDGTLRVWDWMSGHCKATLRGHAGPVVSCDIMQLGTSRDWRIVSASVDGLVKLWSTDGRLLQTLGGHEGPIRQMSCLASPALAVTASDDNTVRVWDLEAGALLRVIRGHRAPVPQVVVRGSNPTRIVSVSSDGACRIDDASTGAFLGEARVGASGEPRLSASSTGNLATCVTRDGTLTRIDLAAPGRDSSPRVALDRRGTQVFCAAGGRITVFDWEQDRAQHVDAGTGEVFVEHVAMNYFTDAFVVYLRGGQVCTWHRDGKLERRQVVPSSATAFACSPDSNRFLTGTADGRITIWDGLVEVATHRVDSGAGVSACACALESVIAMGTTDGHLRVWDGVRDVLRLNVHAHSAPILDCDISYDGTLALAASADGTLTVWEQTGTRRHVLTGHAGAVTACWIGGRMNRAVSCSTDRTVKLWDLDIGACLGSWYGEAPMVGLAVAGEAPVVSAVDRDGRVVVLRVPDLSSPYRA